MISRRHFLAIATIGAAGVLLGERLGNTGTTGLKIGTMDRVFQMDGNPEAVAMAKKFGLSGVQVTLGKSQDRRNLPLEDHLRQKAWLDASKQYGIPLNSTYLDMLNVDCLKDNPNAPMWVGKGIEITKKLRAEVLMLVFFDKCEVSRGPQLDILAGFLKELANEAERAGVILGLENNSSAEDNRYVVDKVRSKACKVWYDVGNSTFNGYDVPNEIRALGRDRICMFHFKDHGYLGQGQVDMPEILRAIADIKFRGYANLETKSPSGNVEGDMKLNLDYLRKLMKA